MAELDIRGFTAQVVAALSMAGEKRDRFTAIHQGRASVLAGKIVCKLGINGEAAAHIQAASALHDIGKIGIPLDILTKPGKLDDDEKRIMSRHPQMGFDIINPVELPWPIKQMILDHHECLDGSGYPNGRKGGEISLATRIVTVSDVTEAVTCHRPYRNAMSIDAAISLLTSGKGTKFDERVVDACVDVLRAEGVGFGEPAVAAAP